MAEFAVEGRGRPKGPSRIMRGRGRAVPSLSSHVSTSSASLIQVIDAPSDTGVERQNYINVEANDPIGEMHDLDTLDNISNQMQHLQLNLSSRGTRVRGRPRGTRGERSRGRRTRSSRGQQHSTADNPHLDKYPLALCNELTTVHSLSLFEHQCTHCGAIHWLEERIKTSSASNPKFSKCCGQGSVQLPAVQEPPLLVKHLLDGSHNNAESFQQSTRNYNNALAFVSTGLKMDQSVWGPSGVYTLRVNGELIHRIGSLLPEEGSEPAFLQIYAINTSEEQRASIRCRNNPALDSPVHRSLLLDLNEMLQTALNPFVGLFKTATERLQTTGAGQIILRAAESSGRDSRRFNLPTTEEIGMCIVGDAAEAVTGRDIILQSQGGNLQRINEMHRYYLPLRYPLLYPFGETGWHIDIALSTSTLSNNRSSDEEHQNIIEEISRGRHGSMRVSQNQYLRYYLSFRRTPFSLLHNAGKLFQELAVDFYAAVEANRLRYQRSQAIQNRYRTETLQDLQDAIARGIQSADIGRQIVVTPTFTGSPRAMQALYQDAMALVRRRGKPSLFITFTCNPQWKELRQAFLPGQNAKDRFDLVCRVFKCKLDSLLDDLIKKSVFGIVAGHVHTIEFQKRGLPHAHILIILSNKSRIDTVNRIDRAVCAELPDPEQEPELYSIVGANLLHGPCGPSHPNQRCMSSGKCSKGFPKEFQEQTHIRDDKFPVYRRRNNGRCCVRPNTHEVIDNRWVVPYNKWVTFKYAAHINVEVVQSIHAVKYLYKYITKGHDRLLFGAGSADEISNFLDARYLTPHESVWRIMEYRMHGIGPPVQQLQLHMPNQQMVRFDGAGNNDQSTDIPARTTLTEYFTACSEFPEQTRDITYDQMPTLFRWNLSTKQWQIRKRGVSIGRIYFAGPSSGDRFYLRILLLNVKGATSFENLRTVNGVQHANFRAACVALGLCADDEEYQLCLREAATIQSGQQLRSLFAYILLNCEIAGPAELWNEFKGHLTDDCSHKLRTLHGISHPSDDQVSSLALHQLNQQLQRFGKCLSDFSLPEPIVPINELIQLHIPQIIQDELAYEPEICRRELNAAKRLFNEEQKAIFAAVENSLDRNKGGMYFLDGPGGTGKTFVENALLNKVRGCNPPEIALAVASTGIAATLLKGGRTAHNRFKIPVEINDNLRCNVSAQSDLAELLKRVRLIIWDEVPSQHRRCVEAVDRCMREVRHIDHFFGNTTVLFAGDFRQCLPVVKNGGMAAVIDACITSSPLWQHVSVFRLHSNMRLLSATLDEINRQLAERFANWLLSVGDGQRGEIVSSIVLQSSIKVLNSTTDVSQLVRDIYSDIPDSLHELTDYFAERIIVDSTNNNVTAFNSVILRQQPGSLYQLYGTDSIVDSETSSTSMQNENVHAQEHLNSISLPSFPPHCLLLKIGCPVIILRNIDPANSICNGSRAIVISIKSHVLQIMLTTGPKKGYKIFLPKVSLHSTTDDGLGFIFYRRQFPIKLAYAMTINKCQGQSLRKIGICLRRPCFAHGQLYVALSRASDCNNISVLLPDDAQGHSKKTLNVVMQHVLEAARPE